MSESIELALIGLALAVVNGGFAWLNRQDHKATQNSIEVVRQDVNGKMEKMQEVIKTGAKAEGKLEGLAEAEAKVKHDGESKSDAR